MSDLSTLEGELIGFTYATPDGGFAVAKVRDGKKTHTVVGPLGHVTEGQFIVLRGAWITHPTFGPQFKAASLLVEEPRTHKGLELFLSSHSVKGLGPEYARRVVERFGLDVLKVLDTEPHRLLEVSGIGKKRLATITQHWQRDQANREVIALLRGHGVGQALTNRIVDKYGNKSMGIVTGQPYRLCADIRGVGFRTADHIAREQGIGVDHPARAEAALIHSLREAEGHGHCFLPRHRLLRAVDVLDVPPQAAEEALGRLRASHHLIAGPCHDPASTPIYTPEIAQAEAYVAARLAELAASPPRKLNADLSAIEQRLTLKLNEGQRRAVETALMGGLTVITGGPGTGKTTIVKAMLAASKLMGDTWRLAAPTGRAAQRLGESTGAEGKTLHRLLEYNGRTRDFTRGPDNPIDATGVLIDEASMIDIRLMASVLSALRPGCRLVLVGDADQLPSVGPGKILRDIIASGQIAVARLTEVYRQAADSGIVRNAHRINEGREPISGEKEARAGSTPDFFVVDRRDAHEVIDTLRAVVGTRLRAKGFDPMRDVQVLTPMHGGLLGTENLNRELQALLNPVDPRGEGGANEVRRGDTIFREGDRVIQVKNDYDNDIFNGDVGRIVLATKGSLIVDFGDGGQRHEVSIKGERLSAIQLAYAISIHKSQGSEYPAVVMILSRAHRIMLRRNLVYTGVTRARRFCCLIGDSWALQTAIRESGGDERHTRLADRLIQEVGG